MKTYDDLFDEYKKQLEDGSAGLVRADKAEFLKLYTFYYVMKMYETKIEKEEREKFKSN